MIKQFLDMNRRDLLLQQMGVQQWQLCRPQVLQGVVNREVSADVRLLVLSDELLAQNQPLLQDLLRGLELNEQNCLCSTFEQLDYLQIQQPLNCLLFGQPKESETLNVLQQHSALKNLWISLPINELQTQPAAKRALWQQIQQSQPLEF